MNVNTDTIQEIRTIRVETDPVIAHKGNEDWVEENDVENLQITEARVKRNKNADLTTPFEKATWPEVTLLCFTQSFDARFPSKKLLGVYQYALQQSAEYFDSVFDDLFPDEIDIVTTKDHKEIAEEFRHEIAVSQHQHFIDNVYDSPEVPTDGVPKAFWKQQNNTDTEENKNAQIKLTDY